ncbi:MAG: peptide deformylase, partial [Pseudomonadota bacterium]
GVLQALAVVDASDTRGQAVRLANPEVIAASGDLRLHDEGSPNLPGVSAKLKRPRVVTVRYMDEHGEIVEREFADLWSTSVQHQIDHLAGKMYFDRLSKVKRDMLLRKAQKATR